MKHYLTVLILSLLMGSFALVSFGEDKPSAAGKPDPAKLKALQAQGDALIKATEDARQEAKKKAEELAAKKEDESNRAACNKEKQRLKEDYDVLRRRVDHYLGTIKETLDKQKADLHSTIEFLQKAHRTYKGVKDEILLSDDHKNFQAQVHKLIEATAGSLKDKNEVICPDSNYYELISQDSPDGSKTTFCQLKGYKPGTSAEDTVLPAAATLLHLPPKVSHDVAIHYEAHGWEEDSGVQAIEQGTLKGCVDINNIAVDSSKEELDVVSPLTDILKKQTSYFQNESERAKTHSLITAFKQCHMIRLDPEGDKMPATESTEHLTAEYIDSKLTPPGAVEVVISNFKKYFELVSPACSDLMKAEEKAKADKKKEGNPVRSGKDDAPPAYHVQ